MAPGAVELTQTGLLPVFRDEDRRNLSGFTTFYGFVVREQELRKVRKRLKSIVSLTDTAKQFVATMLDTETAIGYYRRKQFYKRFGFVIGKWTAYIAVKMTYKGDIALMANLLGLKEPEKTRAFYNTLKGTRDVAWSIQTSGIVAYFAIKTVAPFVYNEKTSIEAQSIIRHGPYVSAEQRHPFEVDGGVRLRRGVWTWPSLDKVESVNDFKTA